MFHLMILVFLLIISAPNLCDCSSNTTKLHLMGLFPFTGTAWPGGQAMSIATQLALQDINASPDILPDYELVVIQEDSACDGGIATNSMYRQLYDHSTTKIAILGPGCSIATEPTSQAAHYWNLLQMTISSSTLLANRDQFPLLFRVLPTESVLNDVKLALFQEFNWEKVATLHQTFPIFMLATAELHKKAKSHGIEIIATESFVDDPSIAVENIQKSGARIIVGGFYADMGRRVFCEVYKRKLYGAKYVWILPGWFYANWWQAPDESIECSTSELDEAVKDYLGIFTDTYPADERRKTPTVTGLTTSEFLESIRTLSGLEDLDDLVGISEMSGVYDMTLTVALGLHEAQEQLAKIDPPRKLEEFQYDDDITRKILFDIISNISFEGLSGPVKYNEVGDRLGTLDVYQLQDSISVSVGLWESSVLSWEGRKPIHWQGGAPPIDFKIEKETRQTIKLPVFISGVVFTITGISLALCFLAFNIKFRKLRVIKMSSPNINNLMLIGGIMAYVSIIIFGIDTNISSTQTFLSMCKTKTWCLSIGFSMAFGSMFSKTWRVHKIFTNKTAMKTVVKDTWLLSCVAALVLIDVMILILWEVADPIVVVEHFGTALVDEDNDDIVYIPIRMMCESSNQTYFIGAFYVINGLLLVFGAFLAWETRNVSIPALNDSKYIGICVYNILVLSFVGVLVSFVVEERNTNYTLIATIIWSATTLTLCVVFVPKIKMRKDVRPTQNTILTGLPAPSTQNSNTEDMKKELQFLRQELQRLEKINLDQGNEKVKQESTRTVAD